MRGRGLPDDCDELTALRAFRDRLCARPEGAALLEHYHRVAPRIVATIRARPDAQARWKELYQNLVRPCVALLSAGMDQRALELYRAWVEALLCEVEQVEATRA
ncbi:MAG: hypothetical protein AB7N76_33595 [Planctomycetota bacterium]